MVTKRTRVNQSNQLHLKHHNEILIKRILSAVLMIYTEWPLQDNLFNEACKQSLQMPCAMLHACNVSSFLLAKMRDIFIVFVAKLV